MEDKKAVFLSWTMNSSYNVNINYIYYERKKEDTYLLRSTKLLS